MSRIGKIPIKVPEKTQIDYTKQIFSVKGEFGSLTRKIPDIFNLRFEENILYLTLKNNKIRKSNALYGLYRTLIYNMVIGVSEQFKLTLRLNGVGYKATIEKDIIILNLGYSHPIKKNIPTVMNISATLNINQ
jgi:large subunit ribosomal protein L6